MEQNEMFVIFMHASGKIRWGDFHPILVHFPIVLFTLTLVCDLLAGVGKKGAGAVAPWMLWSGTLLAIPTMLAGWEASETFPVGDPLVTRHMWLAFTTAAFAVIYSLFRLKVTYWPKEIHPFVYVVLSLILLSLTYWTAFYGGLLTHGTSPFSF